MPRKKTTARRRARNGMQRNNPPPGAKRPAAPAQPPAKPAGAARLTGQVRLDLGEESKKARPPPGNGGAALDRPALDIDDYDELELTAALMSRVLGMAKSSLDSLVRMGVLTRRGANRAFALSEVTRYCESMRQKGNAGMLVRQADVLAEVQNDPRCDIDETNALVVRAVEEARLTRARADEREVKVAEKQNQLLPVELVTLLCAHQASAIRQALLVMHTKLQSRVPGIELDVVQVVKEIAYEALEQISQTGIPDELDRRMRGEITVEKESLVVEAGEDEYQH